MRKFSFVSSPILIYIKTISTKTRKKRRGFLFTMPLMLGMGILIFASMIAISQLFVTVGGPMIPDLLADMPTIFQYNDNGDRLPQYMPIIIADDVPVSLSYHNQTVQVTQQEFSESFPVLSMYQLMVKIAFGVFVILLMLAGLSYFFEEFNLVRQGTAYGIIAKIIVLIPLYFILPYLWDMMALVIESSALYLMDPFGGDPHERTAKLWCMLGSVACNVADGSTTVNPVEIFEGIEGFDKDTALNQDSWNNSLQTPLFGEGFIINVLLALFKGFSVMFMTAMMFVLSAIRVLLTEVIIVAFPLVSAIGLIPWINTKQVSDMFQQNLIGLAIAPIMSAIVLSIGLSTVDSQNLPPLRMWFQLLSIGFLAIFFPVMLSPLLGNLSTKVGTMVSTAITSASVAGSAGLRGATQGIAQVSGSLKTGAGLNVGGNNNNSGTQLPSQGGGISSADMGTATSGVPSMANHLSLMDKLKMYGQAGTLGMLGGLGSGMIDTTTQQMGVGGMGSNVSKHMMDSSGNPISSIVQNTSVSSLTRAATQQMVQAQSMNSTTNSVPVNITDSTVMNPGGSLNTMIDRSGSLDAGQQLATNPEKRQEFVRLFEQKMGLDQRSIPPEMHQKLEQQISEKINENVIGAGQMYQDIKTGTQGGGADTT